MNKKTFTTLTLLCLCAASINAQEHTVEERLAQLEQRIEEQTENHNLPQASRETQSASPEDAKHKFMPQIHGILRGKYEYEPDLNASRFEVRNARLSAEGLLLTSPRGGVKLQPSYKLEIDLCDESQIKMKDAWVRLALPLGRVGGGFTIGQQRMPFSIDAHRNPSAQYFANRSFIAKQVGDMRDVGFQLGLGPLPSSPNRGGDSASPSLPSSPNRGGDSASPSFPSSPRGGKTEMHFDAGIFNGSNLDNQKTAWFKSISYSARAQFIYTSPRGGKVGAVPSVQHQQIADRKASYTSIDFDAYYESPFSPRGGVLHIEAEFLRKFYKQDAFTPCNAFNAMAIYRTSLRGGKERVLEGGSILLRYDYMDNHSDGKKGFVEGTTRLLQSDDERHRLTAGLTFHVANKYFPTDIRLNYEKYWYPNGGTPKESEQDKLVAELMIRF